MVDAPEPVICISKRVLGGMESILGFPGRRSLRLPRFDYSSPGAYFVTLVAAGRQCLFGEIVDGEVVLSEPGSIVCEEWLRSGEIRRELMLDEFVVMPNHLHGLFFLHDVPEPADVAASEFVGATGRSPLQHERDMPGPGRRTVGSFIGGFKASCTKRINELRNTPGLAVWQRNYYEHVVRDEAALNRIRQYIAENPIRWQFDPENPMR